MKTARLVFAALLPLVIGACSAHAGPGWAPSGSDLASSGAAATEPSAAGGSVSGEPPAADVDSGPAVATSGGSESDDSGPSATTSDDAGPAADSGLAGTVETITTVDIPVPANSEMVKCQNFKNPFGKDVAILESDSTMVSSHHMFVFHGSSYNADTNSVADCSGIEFHDLLHMAQTPKQSVIYPTGVGRSLAGTDGLRLLVHLLNPGTTAVTAHVSVAFRVVDPSAVGTLAVSLFFNNAVLTVPEGVSTQSRTFTIPANIKILMAVSHMHSRATGFSATTNTGQVIYKGTDWNEPVAVTYTPAMAVSQGSIVTWSCTYNNMTGKTLTFGESANTNEMCILAGVAYPATPGVMLGTSLESVL
jgi:hypothetical protein